MIFNKGITTCKFNKVKPSVNTITISLAVSREIETQHNKRTLNKGPSPKDPASLIYVLPEKDV